MSTTIAAMTADTLSSEVLYYTVRSCTLGQVLVAGTAQGLAAVLLGDSRSALVQDMQQRFAHHRLDTGSMQVHAWSDAVLAQLEHPAQPHTLPLAPLGGTDFQRAVWQALQTIPAGQTCTYTALAQRLGKPQAVRAVASACAANPLAVLVPCHRVVRSDGGLGGYRWGLARKQWLLQAEGAVTV